METDKNNAGLMVWKHNGKELSRQVLDQRDFDVTRIPFRLPLKTGQNDVQFYLKDSLVWEWRVNFYDGRTTMEFRYK